MTQTINPTTVKNDSTHIHVQQIDSALNAHMGERTLTQSTTPLPVENAHKTAKSAGFGHESPKGFSASPKSTVHEGEPHKSSDSGYPPELQHEDDQSTDSSEHDDDKIFEEDEPHKSLDSECPPKSPNSSASLKSTVHEDEPHKSLDSECPPKSPNSSASLKSTVHEGEPHKSSDFGYPPELQYEDDQSTYSSEYDDDEIFSEDNYDSTLSDKGYIKLTPESSHSVLTNANNALHDQATSLKILKKHHQKLSNLLEQHSSNPLLNKPDAEIAKDIKQALKKAIENKENEPAKPNFWQKSIQLAGNYTNWMHDKFATPKISLERTQQQVSDFFDLYGQENTLYEKTKDAQKTVAQIYKGDLEQVTNEIAQHVSERYMKGDYVTTDTLISFIRDNIPPSKQKLLDQTILTKLEDDKSLQNKYTTQHENVSELLLMAEEVGEIHKIVGKEEQYEKLNKIENAIKQDVHISPEHKIKLTQGIDTLKRGVELANRIETSKLKTTCTLAALSMCLAGIGTIVTSLILMNRSKKTDHDGKSGKKSMEKMQSMKNKNQEFIDKANHDLNGLDKSFAISNKTIKNKLSDADIELKKISKSVKEKLPNDLDEAMQMLKDILPKEGESDNAVKDRARANYISKNLIVPYQHETKTGVWENYYSKKDEAAANNAANNALQERAELVAQEHNLEKYINVSQKIKTENQNLIQEKTNYNKSKKLLDEQIASAEKSNNELDSAMSSLRQQLGKSKEKSSSSNSTFEYFGSAAGLFGFIATAANSMMNKKGYTGHIIKLYRNKKLKKDAKQFENLVNKTNKSADSTATDDHLN